MAYPQTSTVEKCSNTPLLLERAEIGLALESLSQSRNQMGSSISSLLGGTIRKTQTFSALQYRQTQLNQLKVFKTTAQFTVLSAPYTRLQSPCI